MIDNIENNDITQANNRLFRIYNQIIEEARARDFEVKGEKHHVFPKCIFGKNDILVKLTHEEHFKVHYVLWKAYKFKYGCENWRVMKLAHAFTYMNCHKSYERYSYQDAKEYSRLREACKEATKAQWKNLNSEEYKKISLKLSASRKGKYTGEKNSMYGTCAYKINIEKYGIEEANRRKEERNKKHSKTIKGRKMKPFSEEHCKNISKSKIGVKQSKEQINKCKETKAKKTPEEKAEIQRKRLNSLKNRTKDDKYITSQKRKETLSNKSEKEKQLTNTKHSIAILGEKNGMYGKSVLDVWIEEFGEEIANQMWKERYKRSIEKTSGEKNGMFGKSVFQRHVELYGIEEAEKRQKERINKCNETKKRKRNTSF